MKATLTDSAGTMYALCAGAGAGQVLEALASRIARVHTIVTSAGGRARVRPAGGQVITISMTVTGVGLSAASVGLRGGLRIEFPDGTWAAFEDVTISSSSSRPVAGEQTSVSYQIVTTSIPTTGAGILRLILTDGLGRILTDGRGYILFTHNS